MKMGRVPIESQDITLSRQKLDEHIYPHCRKNICVTYGLVRDQICFSKSIPVILFVINSDIF